MKETKETPTEKPLIYSKMIAVMKGAGAIGKNAKNTMQGYNFRGIDDVYNELHGIMAKNGVFTTSEILKDFSEERTSKKGALLLYRILSIRYRFWAEDGSFVSSEVIGEGMDSGDKASNKSMAVAHKYALLQAFCIPTHEKKDPEHDSPELAEKRPKRASINKLLTACKTKEEWVKVATTFQDEWGVSAFDNLSGHPTKKDETFQQLFQVHKDRVTGQQPIDTNTSPDDLQAEWTKQAETCKDRTTYDILETQIGHNRALDTEANWGVMEDIAKELEKAGL